MVPFYNNIPPWISKHLSNTKCSQCSCEIKKRNIIAVGIRELDNRNVTPYIEYKCVRCGHRAMKSFGGNLKGTMEEICLMLLEQLQNQKRMQQCHDLEHSKIKDEMKESEVTSFLEKLHGFETYEDFLKEIGASNKKTK